MYALQRIDRFLEPPWKTRHDPVDTVVCSVLTSQATENKNAEDPAINEEEEKINLSFQTVGSTNHIYPPIY